MSRTAAQRRLPDLDLQERRRDRGQPGEHGPPQLRVAVHQRPRTVERLRRAAVDEVTGQSERSASEADQRDAAKFCRQHPDSLADVGDLVGFKLTEPGHVAVISERLVQHRAHAWADVDVQPGCLQRQDDVAEQDGRIDPVPADSCNVISVISCDCHASSIAVRARRRYPAATGSTGACTHRDAGDRLAAASLDKYALRPACSARIVSQRAARRVGEGHSGF
jgi:hypothetical protein